jgi:hypothetical protein
VRAAPCVAAVFAGLVILSGCGGSSQAPKPEPETIPFTGYFAGRSADGLGASVDMAGFDATAVVVDRALLRLDRPAALAIVAVVNGTATAIARPRFVAQTLAGGSRPMRTARAVLAGIPGTGARDAYRTVGPAPTRVRAGKSAQLYLVLDGATREEVLSIDMVLDGTRTTLASQER